MLSRTFFYNQCLNIDYNYYFCHLNEYHHGKFSFS